MSISGTSTPLSASSTLTNQSSPRSLKATLSVQKSASTQLPASYLVEWIASRSSSTVFVYDVAAQADFGRITQEWANSASDDHHEGHAKGNAKVLEMQTRVGAGLDVVGRLSQGTSKEAELGLVLSAYTTPPGLALMAPALSLLPAPTVNGRLVVHVPTVTPIGDSGALSPSTGSLIPFFNAASNPDHHVLIVSTATPQETVDIAALAYTVDAHVVHLFDHHGSAREITTKTTPPLQPPQHLLSPREALDKIGYGYFDYFGSPDAEFVIVVLNGPLAQALKYVASKIPGLGVLIVRVLRPWDESEFKAALPITTQYIHVFDDVPAETTHGVLYQDVLSSVVVPDARGIPSPVVQGHRLTPNRVHQYTTFGPSLLAFVSGMVPVASFAPPSLENSKQKKLLFFSSPGSPLSTVPNLVSQTFATSASLSPRLVTNYDAFAKPGGVALSRLLISPKADADEFHVPLELVRIGNGIGEDADLVVVTDHTLLKSQSIFSEAKFGTPFVVFTPWTEEEFVSNMTPASLFLIRQNNARVYLYNTKAAVEQLLGGAAEQSEHLEYVLAHLVVLRIYLGGVASSPKVVEKVAQSVYGAGAVADTPLTNLAALSWEGLRQVSIPEEDESEREAEEGDLDFGKEFVFNTIAMRRDDVYEDVGDVAKVCTWHDAAKHLIFKEALAVAPPSSSVSSLFRNLINPKSKSKAAVAVPDQIPTLRPDLPEETFLVTCTVNKRLTPLTYNRNVFHLEFDTKGTGLKYAIGEALGVHGWNDDAEVLEFCEWYGIDPNGLLSLPVPGSGGEGAPATIRHTRTVFQALQQQVDIFGRPPKSFYAALAEHATLREDRMALLFIAAPEGAATFKKLSEGDTVTFADVLRKFASARPPLGVLVEMVGDIKPRHYSIASAQSVVGDRVDLLVVTVDWVTPSGSPRFGQCTRYLAGLQIGQKVTVSIKPSVMKLPPDDMQPIIMAGLGTGAAPFRAFMQHRALLVSKKVPVGPLLYYFGSRHRSEEYLYGEEIEAFITDGVITHTGLAFSRDQKRKVYIQHKMREDAEMLARMLVGAEKGVFYLCGPTWPVPDVFEALVGALETYHGMDRTQAGDFLEGLKEEERYVLEVY